MTSLDRRTDLSRSEKSISLQDNVLESIQQALADLRFGSVEIIVHEGKVTQIERKEKFRLNQN